MNTSFTAPILCLVCLCLLGWVVLLQGRLDSMKALIRRLRDLLASRDRSADPLDIEVSGGRRLTPTEVRRVDRALGGRRRNKP